jgi:hypothetical protein
MAHDKIYYVKRLRLLNFLVNKGFTDYEVVPDPTSRKGFNWFLYEYTDELHEAITEYFEQLNK